MTVNVGSASVTIMPTMHGFAGKFDSAFAKSGSKSGAAFSRGVSGGVSGVGARIAAEGQRGGSGLSRALSAASGAASGLSSKMSALAGAVGGFAASAVSGLVGAVGGLVGEMAAASDSADKFASTLRFAGFDSSQIEELTASTQEYADRTVYDLGDIRNVTAQLASNGVEGFADLAEAAGNLNAVAGGNADTFRSVGMVMTQTAGQGKLTTENFNQLSDAVAGASGPLQQTLSDMGAFEGGVGNFRQALEDGQISADEFFAAVQELGMTDVAKEAATSTATIEGAMGNLEASVVGVGANLITAFKPFITGAIGGAADRIGAISTAIGEMPRAIEEFTTETGEAASAGDVLWVAMQTVGQAAGLTYDQINPIAQALEGIADGVVPMLQEVGATVSDVAGQIASFVLPIVTEVAQFVASKMPAIQGVVSKVMGGIQSVVTTVLPVVKEIWDAVWPQLQVVASTAFDLISSAVSTVMDGIQTVITTVLPVIKAVWDAVWPHLQQVVGTVLGLISSVVSTVMGVIQGIIKTVTSIISGDWSGAWEGIRQVFSSVWEGIQSIVGGAVEMVGSVISGALSLIGDLWNSVWGGVSDFLSSTWEGVKGTVSSGVNAVTDFVGGLPDKIMGFFSDAGRWLLDAGSNIINGLLDGIKNAFNGVKDFVGGIGNWIVEHKGPPSYDRVMLVRNGELIMSGLAAGMRRGLAGSVRSAIDEATREIAGWTPTASAEVSASASARGLSGRPSRAAVASGPTYVVRVDGARVNDVPAIRDAVKALVVEATRGRGDM